MKYYIEKCEQGHLDLLVDFYEKVLAFLISTVNYPKWTMGVYPCRESIESAISKGEQYMCLDNGRIVGAFVLNEDPQGAYKNGAWKASLKEGEYVVVHTLAVLPEEYGKRIASFMTKYCIDTARSSGFKAIRLDVVPDNFPAKKLYEKNGFSFAGNADLERGFEDIPFFSLYELNFN